MTPAQRRVAALRPGDRGPADASAAGWVPGDPDVSWREALDEPRPVEPLTPASLAGGPSEADPEQQVAPPERPGEEDPAESQHHESSSKTPPPGKPPRRDNGLATRLTKSGPWGALAEKWVPETLREARVDPGRRGATVLSLIAALAAVVAAVGVWWSRPHSTPLTIPTSSPAPIDSPSLTSTGAGLPGTGSAGSTPSDASDGSASSNGSDGAAAHATAAPTASTHGPIVVSVTGNVRHPGLVTLSAPARVADAIAAAGGALDDADLTGLNLAAHLSDGASVVIADAAGSAVHDNDDRANPHSGASSGSTAPGDAASETEAININHADAEQLQQLPGVGPVTAAAIVAYRKNHGAFADVNELQAVSGIGPATLARIAPHATV